MTKLKEVVDVFAPPTPKEVVDTLWETAATLVQPPQLCIVIVNDPPGTGTETLAFRHNSLSLSELSAALRAFADKLDAGEAITPGPKKDAS